ncbi:hypothetical protein DVDV_2283 [Desulfovibrio sp. DV]|nr:hypothetical protein DVDV_2283 [Desulfovibrio sp. DV]
MVSVKFKCRLSRSAVDRTNCQRQEPLSKLFPLQGSGPPDPCKGKS